ncbi:MAG: hypothetical protein CMD66_00810 [Gammaproteobacteria bacterium]|nr:hypothetical protein [Gammaproteobacteria bacterium]
MNILLKNLLVHGRKIGGYYARQPFSLWLNVTVLPLLLGVSPAVSYGQSTQTELNCSHDKIICSWKDRVVGIKTPTMIASGFMLDKSTLVTNKHVVEDHTSVRVKFQSGIVTKAEPIPNDHPADLVILNVSATREKFENGIRLTSERDQELRVVAYDQGRRSARIYAEGSYAIHPDWEKYPQARIHSDLLALPGNSGGAVLNKSGELVGVMASGDGNVNEVIPASLIKNIKDHSSEKHRDVFVKRGRAIRRCADLLYESASINKNPPHQVTTQIKDFCLQSNNKQLLDQAGQLFGKWWMFSPSQMFLKESLKLDPQSPNTLMSLAVAYHLDRDYANEKPLLKKYLKLNPSDPQGLRLAVQVAGMLKDKQFGQQALDLMRIHNPNAVELAEEFLTSSFGDQKP